MLKPYKMIFLTALLLISSYTTQASNVIFDMSGVVVYTSGLSAFYEVGPSLFFNYIGAFQNPLSIKPKLFAFLNQIQERYDDEIEARDPAGRVLPQVMCNWLKGTYTPGNIQIQIEQAIDTGKVTFSSTAERNLMLGLSKIMFNPETFVRIQNFSLEMIKFIKECKAQGHNLYILSNWDKESFAILKQQNPEFFAIFDGILLSAEAGTIKPDPAIYQHLMQTFDIKPTDSFFIDDQKVNITAAKKLGIAGCVCPQIRTWTWSKAPDALSVRKQFTSWQRRKQLEQIVATSIALRYTE